MKKILIALVFTLIFLNTNAQIIQKSIVKNNVNGSIIFAELSLNNKESNLSTLKKLNNKLYANYAAKEIVTDEFGNTHQFYQQLFNNIEVIGAGYSIHKIRGKNSFLNGIFADINAISPSDKKINPETAKQLAEKFVLKSKFKAINISINNLKLVICNTLSNVNSRYDLAYKLETNVPEYNTVYLNAITGVILGSESIVCTVNVPGTGETLYSGVRNIIADQPVAGVNNFRLFEERNGAIIHIRNMIAEADFLNIGNATEFWDNDNNWTTAELGNDNVALDIHWAMENILDYWRV